MDILSPMPLKQSVTPTERQIKIAEDLGWRDKMYLSPFKELIAYIDKSFSRIVSTSPIYCRFPNDVSTIKNGTPFYATNNQFALAVTREYIGEEPVYKSDYSMVQASELYQDMLGSFVQHLVRGREFAVYVKVTEIPKDFDFKTQNVITSCSAECDIFIPTGICKGLSRGGTESVTDIDVFASIVADYLKVMSKIHSKGQELCTYFYLTKECDIQKIRREATEAETIWQNKGYRDYRRAKIAKGGEITLMLRQDIDLNFQNL